MKIESQWTLSWSQRPPEEASNFNPAFCGELIYCMVQEFHKVCREPLNFAVAFLILPLVLHEQTRDSLPRKANTAFAGWVSDNTPSLAKLPKRVNYLRHISREALLFGLSCKILAIENGGIVPGPKKIRSASKLSATTNDTDQARKSSCLLGRWFATQATQSAVLQGMGVMP